jgi:pentatricopeptide repeat protein
MALMLILSHNNKALQPYYSPWWWLNTITTKRALPSFKCVSLSSSSSFQQATKPFMGHHHQHVRSVESSRRAPYATSSAIQGQTGFATTSSQNSQSLGKHGQHGGGVQSAELETCVRSTPPPTRKERRRRGDDTALNLKKRTSDALSANHAVVGSWTLQNISMIRSCMEQWLRKRIRPKINSVAVEEEGMMSARERAVWSTKILCRWVDELAVGKNPLVSTPELVQVLHRVLHAWKLLQQQLYQQHHQQQNHSIRDHDLPRRRSEASTRALELLQIVGDLAKNVSVNESSHLWWPSDKAYTMVLEILALHPDHTETMNRVEDLLHERLCLAAVAASRPAQGNVRRVVPLPDLVVWNACLHVLAKCSPYEEKAPERVEALFRRITALPNNKSDGHGGGGGLPRADEKSYAARLHVWAKSGRREAGERAQAILDEMIDKEKMHNRICFNLCITAWARSGHPVQAEKVLWSMMEYHHDSCKDQNNGSTPASTEMRPDHVSFMAAINGWRLSNDPRSAERAENLMSCMQNLCNVTLPESSRSNSSLMNGDDGDLALLLPTTKGMNAVLDTWAGKRNTGPKVENVLRRMITAANKDPSIHPPSLETYTIAIKAWALTTDVTTEEAPERAEALLLELEDLSHAGHDDLTPNVIAYTASIQAWANSRRRDAPVRALSLLRRMQHISRRRGGSDGPRQECAAPNLHTYNTVLYAFAQHGLALDAERLFDEMKDLAQHARDASMSPNSMSYTNLIHAHAKNRLDNSPDRCRELLLAMEMGMDEGNERIMPTASTYSAVLKACGSYSGDDAEAILWRMQGRFANSMTNGCPPPTTRICNSLLKVWSDSHEGMAPQRAESILRWMQDQYSKGVNDSVQPDTTSFDLVIKAWARSRRRRAHEHVARLLEEMKSQEPRDSPDSLPHDATSMRMVETVVEPPS